MIDEGTLYSFFVLSVRFQFMCFSATASFTIAATTAVIGVAVARQVTDRREILLALTPFLFSLQQAIEGVLWLQLSGDGGDENIAALSMSFRIFAEVLWPIYTPVAVLLIEPGRVRRRLLMAIAAVGAILAIHLLSGLIIDAPGVAIQGRSIAYASDVDFLSWRMIPYLLCSCGALALSSHRIINVLAAMIAVGFMVSAYIYFASFISVWCFFTAAASTLIYFHFKRLHAAVKLHQL